MKAKIGFTAKDAKKAGKSSILSFASFVFFAAKKILIFLLAGPSRSDCGLRTTAKPQ
jgi:hypothetical protein